MFLQVLESKATVRGFECHRGAEVQCMFWCMFGSDVTASYCDILQNKNGAHVF
jgi:hypothetical protein